MREIAADLVGTTHAIADRHRRVAWLNERHRRLRQVIEERSNDPDIAAETGGKTGLVAKYTKVTPSGKSVDTFEIDTALLKELRAIEEQAAKELGQWVEKSAHLQVTVDANDDRLTAEQRESVRKALTGDVEG